MIGKVYTAPIFTHTHHNTEIKKPSDAVAGSIHSVLNRAGTLYQSKHINSFYTSQNSNRFTPLQVSATVGHKIA